MTTLASWNVNSLRARLSHILTWLGTTSPDIVGLQETKVTDPNFPRTELEALGYRTIINGQKSYNGVAVLCRHEPEEIDTAIPGFDDAQKRVLGCRFESLYFLNLYVPNGSALGTDKYDYKLAWLAALTGWLEELLATNRNVVIVGDFNIAPEDRDVHDPEGWRDRVLCSEPERQSLRKILDLGFVDTFRLTAQPAASFSWWDYRAGAFRRNRGLRIDLILASEALATTVTEAKIDREPRTWAKPSDHAPVLAVLG